MCADMLRVCAVGDPHGPFPVPEVTVNYCCQTVYFPLSVALLMFLSLFGACYRKNDLTFDL